MKRIISILTFLVLLPSCYLFAGEGMWIPMLLQFNEKEMREMGFQLTAEDIYSINHGSLKDAIVHFGGGCTGEIVSDQGLILTNHHCGYSWIQRHSSIDHDYLTNGFWAMDKSQELSCPGLTVNILREMRNVTADILQGVTDGMTEEERNALIKENTRKTIEEIEKNTTYKASVHPFFLGNEYYLLLNETFRDIRFVGAPPSNIGKFGGDTDNWVWPRHTGDFSVFRIYTGPDGKPADYSPENKPYHPARHLSVSLKGADEGDFAFVFGYPGRTNEYLPAVAVNLEANVIDPVMVDLRGKVLDIYNKYQEADPKVRIQYAAKHASIGNAWKKNMGVIEGIRNFKGVEKKKAFEEKFKEWCRMNNREDYASLLTSFDINYNLLEADQLATTYITECGRRIELITFANRFSTLAQVTAETPQETIQKRVASLREAAATFFKDYYQPIDREVAQMLLTEYLSAQSEEFRPTFLNDIQDVNQYVDALFSQSLFASEEKVLALLDSFTPADAARIEADPAMKAARSINEFASHVREEMAAIQQSNTQLMRIYMKAQMEMQPEKRFSPDANSTLRVTYGKVEGFQPRDGVIYRHFTTLDGVMAKESPDIYDYVVEPRLKELYEKKDFGRYADKDGTMHTCFTASVHTTGGNSGSPILNARGELLGLNFDRCWEGTMSDLIYDPSICRNISVDIRYVLFIIDKFAGAGHLIDEMTVVE